MKNNLQKIISSMPYDKAVNLKKVIREETDSSRQVFSTWWNGKNNPPRKKRAIISRILKMPSEVIFNEPAN